MSPLKEPTSHNKVPAAALPEMTVSVSGQDVEKRRSLSSVTDDSNSSSNEDSPASPKHVRFASTSKNCEITDTDSLTQQEMKAMFMTQEDQKRIFQEISQTLAKAATAAKKSGKRKRNMDTYIDLDAAGNEGIRGLECIVQKRNSNRGKRMKAALNAVMKRQAVDEIDEEWIVNDYRPLLEESKKLARERGLKDEIAGGCVKKATTKNSKKHGKQRLQKQQDNVKSPSPANVSN